MAELKISFTLEDSDLVHLKKMLKQATAAAEGADPKTVVEAARGMAAEIRKFKPPEYVVERVVKLETMVDMAVDEDYKLPAATQKRVLLALSYFTAPEDLIKDTIPGLGFLDDAIMIELIAEELKHEIKAYEEFRGFRKSASRRSRGKGDQLDGKLQEKLKKLRARVTERQAADRQKKKEKRSFRLW